MFWGLILKSNKRYSQKVTKAFHVSQAVLDTALCGDETIQLILTSDQHNYILCNLRKNKVEQVTLDLNFAEGEEIAFTSQGNGCVHLTGYMLPEEDDLDFGEEDMEDEEMESVMKSLKHEKPNSARNKKALKAAEDEEDDDEDEEDSDFDAEKALKQIDDEDEDDDDDSDEVDDDEDVDDSDSDEEEIQEPKPKQAKLDKGKQNGMENGNVVAKDKSKKEKKKEKQQQKQQEKSPKGGGEKSLQGGVKIEDIRVGNGAEAKQGKKVQVYYEGRLKSNNKVFDSSKQGAGFKFILGRGEVIRGWDVGVAGMKIGGKRRITCPPNMAYGPKGSPPVIPPNSTLVFEVELKHVN